MQQSGGPGRAGELDPGLRGPLRLRPFRARRLDLARVAGEPGQADRSVSADLVEGSGVRLDDVPALYVHEYRIAGRRVRGVVGLLELGLDRLVPGHRAEAAVLPHEAVEPVRVARLTARMAALGLDPAPILLLPMPASGGAAVDLPDPQPDPQPEPQPDPLGDLVRTTVAQRPLADGRDASRHLHRLWRVEDDAAVAVASAAVAERRFLLADGHHRWAAHLALERERVAGGAPDDGRYGDGRALVMLVDTVDHSPVLHALHRVVLGIGSEVILEALAAAGFPTRRSRAVGAPAPPDAPLRQAHDEVVVADGRRRVRVVVEHDETLTVVERVHTALAHLVGPSDWHYHHRVGSALRQVRQERSAVALVLPPPPMSEVAASARAGRVLPVKATSFQPKPPLGVLFRSWRDG